jgi:uncharacterized protein (TIGR02246 family)
MADDATLDSILARLERAETLEAARGVVVAYGRAVDDRDWTALGEAFSESAVLRVGGTEVVGRAAIVDSLRGMLPDGLQTMHAMINPTVTWLEPGVAQVDTTIIYTHASPETSALGWGSYVDVVSIVDGVAKITEKSFTPAGHGEVRPGWGPASDESSRLERLETAERAREAAWRYAVAVDTQDFDLLASVFTPDAVLTTRRGSRHGRDEIIAYYRPALAEPMGRKHFIVNQAVTWVSPGEAVMESYFMYTYAGDDTSILGWGSYSDRVRVIDNVGYIEAKRISIDIQADTRVGWATEPDS